MKNKPECKSAKKKPDRATSAKKMAETADKTRHADSGGEFQTRYPVGFLSMPIPNKAIGPFQQHAD
ncbi:heat-shock protein [Segatella buccae]|jgi:hypothetical protein|uniref:heat-shock protein n=1 Tax=Segatella buccae TaxID=28126 RepID=UPI0022E86710|nr:heat-shock protein [Segatella buccae]